MSPFFRWLIRLVLFAVVAVLGIAAIRTVSFSSRQIQVEPADLAAVPEAAAERLSQSIRFPTVSTAEGVDTAAFLALDFFLTRSFPLVDSLLEHRRVNRFSHLYRWPGRKSGLEPVLLMGHLDVVPVEPEALHRWSHPPFSGRISDGQIWGRGTLDDKGACLGILEAVEMLLREGFSPERSIYLAFGHDEEVSGLKGAKAIAHKLKEDGIQLAYVLDEGQVVLEDALPGLKKPLAMIGNSEKGYVTLKLTATLEEGGHSSMPPRETAVNILAQGIERLQENLLPSNFEGPVGEMFSFVGPEMAFPFNAVFANQWLTKGLLEMQFRNDPAANAMIRTTTAPTMIQGGVKDNVLPISASAMVNFRILPGETTESVQEEVGRILRDDRIQVSIPHPEQAQDPAPVSPTDAFGFHILHKTIREVFPETVVAPALMIGMTDSRHYQIVCSDIYRFFPVQIDREDLKGIHGINEHISVANYKRAIQFYRQLIVNSSR
jgi:carboxypeptidase PM20D1